MSNFLVVLGCSDDDSVSISSPTVPVMSVSVSPANSSSPNGAIAQNSNNSCCGQAVVVCC